MTVDDNPDPGNVRPFDLDFKPVQQPQRRRNPLLLYIVAVTSVLVVAVAGALFFFEAGDDQKSAEVPLIRVDLGPVKVRPADPGGMQVPDRDKLIYNRITETEEPPLVERLLPPPEMPAPLPAAPEPASEAPPGPALAPAPDEKSEAPDPLMPQGKPEALMMAPAAGQEKGPMVLAPPVPETAKEPAPKPAMPAKAAPQPKPPAMEMKAAAPPPPPPAPAPKAAPKKMPMMAAKGGAYRVQLAALRSAEGVEKEWKRLKGQHADLLGGLELDMVRADLGPGKGVYYRLRAGPLASRADASALCAKLAKRKVGCFAVGAGG